MINFRNDLLRREMTVFANHIGQTIETELLLRGVFPFKEAVGDEQEQVSWLKAKNDRSLGSKIRQDTERQGLGVESSEFLFRGGIKEKWCVARGQKFDPILARSANGGNICGEALGGEILAEGFIDLPDGG